MKSLPRFLLASLVIIGVATGAIAQDRAVIAKVPFDFTVGEHSLPAGDYVLSSPHSNVVKIQSQDQRVVTFVVVTRGFQESHDGSQLEFTKYGRHYFLHRIVCPIATGMNLNIPSGKPEKRVQSQEAKNAGGETVVVAAK